MGDWPGWVWALLAYGAGMAVYGHVAVVRGARRRVRERAGEVWDQPSLPGSKKE